MVVNNIVRYEAFILVGFLMAGGTLIKLLGFYNFSSDWFWFLAGVGLAVEGAISLNKQRQFDKKYKIVERNEPLKKVSKWTFRKGSQKTKMNL